MATQELSNVYFTIVIADVENVTPIGRLCLGCAGRAVGGESSEVNRSFLDQHLLPIQQIALGRDRRSDSGGTTMTG